MPDVADNTKVCTCNHRERINNIDSGIDEGVCGVCQQVRRYEWKEGAKGKPRRIAKVVKLGRIGDKIVLPSPDDVVDLGREENVELKAAMKPDKQVSREEKHIDSGEKKEYQILPAEEKRRIAFEAKETSFKKAGKKYDIPWQTVRAWVLTYCCKPATAPSQTAAAEQVELPEFPAFNESWPTNVKVEWLRSYPKLCYGGQVHEDKTKLSDR